MADRTKVLCVDDHAANLRIRAMFLEMFGCEVIAVEDHHSAIKAVAENHLDIVVIDYHLGNGATGEDVAHDVRALRPELPMIMLSETPIFLIVSMTVWMPWSRRERAIPKICSKLLATLCPVPVRTPVPNGI